MARKRWEGIEKKKNMGAITEYGDEANPKSLQRVLPRRGQMGKLGDEKIQERAKEEGVFPPDLSTCLSPSEQGVGGGKKQAHPKEKAGGPSGYLFSTGGFGAWKKGNAQGHNRGPEKNNR